MADDQISVELVAKVDQLVSGLGDAKSAVQGMSSAFSDALRGIEDASKNSEVALSRILFALGDLKNAGGGGNLDAVRGDLHNLEDAAKGSESALQKLVSMETFDFLKERATEALEAIKGAFESTIGKAEEFGLANAKFAAIMGTSEADAAGLSAALHGVGVSAEQYEGISLRLQQRLETGTGINKELAESLKGPNDEALRGEALMERLKDVLGNYSEEGQNAAVVQLGLGRRMSDLTDAFRVNAESVEHQKQIYADMGVNLDGTGQSSQKLEEAVNDLHTAWEAMGIELGQRMMPIATAAIGWLGGPGKAMVVAISDAVKFLLVTFDSMATIVAGAVRATAAVLDTLWENIKGGGKALWDVLHGNFSAALDDLKEGASKTAAAWKDALAGMKADAHGTVDLAATLFAPQDSAPEANPFKMKTGDKASPKAPGKKAPKDNSALEEIQDAEKLALAKEQIEEQTNAHLLAMGQESESAFLAQATALENETYAIKLAALNKELALPGRTKAEVQKTHDEIQLLEVTHQGALLKIKQEGETQQAALDKEALADFIKADDEKLKSGTAAIERLYVQDKISADQKFVLEQDLTRKIEQEQLARLNAEISKLTPGTKAYDEAIKERTKLNEKFSQDSDRLADQRLQKEIADINKWSGPVTSSFNSAINGMLVQGKSFTETMDSLFKSMASGFLEVIEKMAEEWAVKHIAMAIIAQATQATSAVAQVSSLAAVAGAGAAASQAGIPIVGPALAAGASAAMVASVLSLDGLASAAGGMVLDRDQLVFAHQREMILPANISGGLQAMVANGGGGGGDTNVTYAPTIHGHEPQSLSEMLRTQGPAMIAFMAQAARDGKFKARPGQ